MNVENTPERFFPSGPGSGKQKNDTEAQWESPLKIILEDPTKVESSAFPAALITVVW